MDVSPSLLDDPFKTDFFDLVTVNCPDYNFNSLIEDTELSLLGFSNINENNLLSPLNHYTDDGQDPHTDVVHPSVKTESSDKMWGGGSTTESVTNTALGNTIFITYSTTEIAAPDTSDISHLPSPQSCELFTNILNEKPLDVLVSHSHRSPGSDCVSYVSAGSGYSDSGISTSLDHETLSPNGHTDPVDFDRLIEGAVDSMVYSPGDGSGLPSGEESTMLDGGLGYVGNGTFTYLTNSTVSQSSDTSILEGALRGTVRRPTPTSSTMINNTNIKQECKTLTVMDNMAPLPSLTSAFKLETLGLAPSQPQITSTNGLYHTNTYGYIPSITEEYTTLDNSFTKLSTASTTKADCESKHSCRKRKYTKRGSAEEPSAKGRLLHFCAMCNKGFKDKYSVNVHHRTHTGEKPFNCELCGKSFRQKAHLAKHVQIHNAPKPPGKR